MEHVGMKYTAIHTDGIGSLITYPPYENSVEGIRKLIDERNAKARTDGYPECAWLICQETYRTRTSETGEFEFSEHRTQVVEKYPAGL